MSDVEPGLQKATKSKLAGKRRMAREMALQMLYQIDMGGSTREQAFRRFDRSDYFAPAEVDGADPDAARVRAERRHREVTDAFDYARNLVTGASERQDEIDELISQQADNWRLERMPAVDRNILRLAIYELLHEEDIPKLVVVDEAIELAKRFSTEQSSRFVNGLLDGLLKKQTFPGRMT